MVSFDVPDLCISTLREYLNDVGGGVPGLRNLLCSLKYLERVFERTI